MVRNRLFDEQRNATRKQLDTDRVMRIGRSGNDGCVDLADQLATSSTERVLASAAAASRQAATGSAIATSLMSSKPAAILPYLGVDRFTTPGDRPFAVHEAAGMRIGMNICYDGGFPESARVLALLGADLVVLPTNWPPGAECMAGCVVNARAMENNIFYASCDRVGTERTFPFHWSVEDLRPQRPDAGRGQSRP